jgi:hypothetical protein
VNTAYMIIPYQNKRKAPVFTRAFHVLTHRADKPNSVLPR